MLKSFMQGWVLCAGFWVAMANAAPQGEMRFGSVVLFYSVFNSTLLPAEMADQYQLKPRADEVIVNITLQDAATGNPLTAQIEGTARNLIQHTKPLLFKEVKETTGVYYLAVLRTTEREVFHFFIKVQPPTGEAFTATFSQELFINP